MKTSRKAPSPPESKAALLQRQLNLAAELTTAICNQEPRQNLFKLLGERLEDWPGIQGVQIVLLNPESGQPELVYARRRGQVAPARPQPGDDPLLRQVLQHEDIHYIGENFASTYQALNSEGKLFDQQDWPQSWAGAPLYSEQRPNGMLSILNFEHTWAFPTQTLQALRLLAQLLGVALQSLRLADVEVERRLVAETLQEVAVAINYSLDLNETLELILGQLGRVVRYDSASVMLWEGNELQVAAQCGFRTAAQFSARPRLEKTPNLNEVVHSRHPLLITDTKTDARWLPFDAGDTYIRCWIGVPLIVQSQVIGILNVDSETPGFYGEHEVALASAFAGQASIAIQNARLYAEAQQQASELGALRQATLSLAQSLETPTVIDSILVSAMSLLGRITELHVFRYENDRLILGMIRWPENAQSYPTAEPRQGGLTYNVARSGQTIVVEDMENHPLYLEDQRGLKGACIGIPLKISERVVGVMIVSYPEARHFPLAELRMLHLFADHAAIALENSRLFEQAQAEIQRRRASEDALRQANLRLEDQLRQIEILQAQLREQAIRDPLTGLYNRRYLNETLVREFDLAQRQQQSIGIIMLDLDHFKHLNDNYGHINGDHVLQVLGKLILSKVRRSDIPCRYGGEEFCIVLPGASKEITLRRAETLRRRFAALAPIADQPQLHVTLSIGVAVYPQHGDTPETVLDRADQALYQAKARGRNCVVVAGESSPDGPSAGPKTKSTSQTVPTAPDQ